MSHRIPLPYSQIVLQAVKEIKELFFFLKGVGVGP